MYMGKVYDVFIYFKQVVSKVYNALLLYRNLGYRALAVDRASPRYPHSID